jgi:hypothetical protein
MEETITDDPTPMSEQKTPRIKSLLTALTILLDHHPDFTESVEERINEMFAQVFKDRIAAGEASSSESALEVMTIGNAVEWMLRALGEVMHDEYPDGFTIMQGYIATGDDGVRALTQLTPVGTQEARQAMHLLGDVLESIVPTTH